MKWRDIKTAGALVATLALGIQAQAAFTGDFALTTPPWVFTPDGGVISITGNTELRFDGAAAGPSLSSAFYEGPTLGGTTTGGFISFDWAFNSGDGSASGGFAYMRPGDLNPTSVTLGSGGPGVSDSSSFSVFLPAGSTFEFMLNQASAFTGKPAASLIIDNFNFVVPEASTLWAGVLLMGVFGFSVLRQLARRKVGKPFFF